MQNIQMMSLEPCEDGSSVNIVTWSGVDIGKEKGKFLETDVWVRKATNKEMGFNVSKMKETFMEAKKSFADEGASTSRTQNMGKFKGANTTQETYSSLLA